MKEEIKKPDPALDRPKFFREPYDYRNVETAGEYCGVGEPGKEGQHSSSSLDAMPPGAKRMMVPRDHKG